MKTKWSLINQMGMRDAREEGIADRWDQLLFAVRELLYEVERNASPQESLAYLAETLALFDDEQ